MPAHVLHGDSFLVARAQAGLESETGASSLLDANRHVLLGADIGLNGLMELCHAIPFMDPIRLVLVQGLLTTFEGKRPARRPRRNTNQDRVPNGSLGQWDGLVQAIASMPPTTLLIFSDGQVSENNPMLRALSDAIRVQSLPTPSGPDLARWIKEAVQAKSADISPSAVSALSNMVGSDLWALDRELEKLCLYAWGRTIEESDVETLVAKAKEANIFNAVDAMMEGRQGDALFQIHQLRNDGRDSSYIIAMVQRQVRLLALAKNGIETGASQSELGSRMGTSSQFVIRKTIQQAKKHTWEDITWRYQRLLEADLAIKRGKMASAIALDLLVADQSSLAGR